MQERDARIYTHGTLIPYPFQKFFDRIPNPEVVEACRRGLHNLSDNGAPPKNFEEFIIRKFGQGIANHFMLPYNRKIWASSNDTPDSAARASTTTRTGGSTKMPPGFTIPTATGPPTGSHLTFSVAPGHTR